MNHREPNYPPPAVVFDTMPNNTINATARLDFMDNGLRLDVHEQWGLDNYVLTLSRQGLSVSFDATFFHLQALEQTLAVVRQKIVDRADRAMGKTPNSKPQTPMSEQEATEKTGRGPMIIARGVAHDGEVLVLGLSRENIRRLTASQPIRLSRKTHGQGIPEGWEISIVFGETEMAIKRALEKAGAIGPETKVTVDPRLK